MEKIPYRYLQTWKQKKSPQILRILRWKKLTDLIFFGLKICKQNIFSSQILRWKKKAYRSDFFCLQICKQNILSSQILRSRGIAYRPEDFFGLKICKQKIVPYISRSRKKITYRSVSKIFCPHRSWGHCLKNFSSHILRWKKNTS